ncbi:MAG TPA: gamma-glutamyl-gamma-aminobutyrate hydrolase family protein [Candidatus Acidoferrales bacterium]|nr:gamma-glutamyl-gamma-aminobutyrate hydrolase family protein [Candidatus Acidoferrales bacterium]
MPADQTAKPRVGIPYRTQIEEVNGERAKFDNYVRAIEKAGGEAREISLRLSAKDLAAKLKDLDAIVLTGSPADVHPALYKGKPHPKCSFSDPRREATDFALLDHAFAEHLPVLAICYGIQSLNVYLKGTLIQHVSAQDPGAEVRTPIPHADSEQQKTGFRHAIQIDQNTRLAKLAGSLEGQVNSSHHQAILEPGRKLKIVARAPDGIVEAVEWAGDSNWVMGVQWHPERMVAEDALAQALFRELVVAARHTPVHA